MRLRNVTGSKDMIAQSQYVIHEPQDHKGKWSEVFENDRPIHIEIGMGKGKFIMGMAQAHPDINYIGIEKYSTVLLRAIQKMEENELPNVVFIRMDAEDICEVFDKEEIDKIYLNFSDPWPKDRHAKRRLPSREFPLEELEPAGWKAEAVTRDLHHDEKLCAGNIMTEYEEKFSAQGNPIYKYIIYR